MTLTPSEIRASVARNRWTIGPALAAVAIVAVSLWVGSGTFREGFMANFVATIAGIIAGVPIALALAERQRSADLETQAIDAGVRRVAVLRLLCDELAEDRDLLIGKTDGTRIVEVPFLRSDLWRALADGGELRWIDDVQLIGVIARAYQRVDTTTELERKYFDLTHDAVAAAVTYAPAGRSPASRVLTYIVDQDERTMAALNVAIDALAGAGIEPSGAS